MRLLTSWILASLISWQVFSQKPPVKYGAIPMEDMVMTTYERDSSAVAVILVDYLKTYARLTRVSSTSTKATSIFERQVRIKILKKEGLHHADVIIPFPLLGSGTDRSRITNLRATTYNLEAGKIVETEMSKEGVFKENLIANLDLQKFTLPNVKEGSVLEYSYTVNSPLSFPDWEFQHTIPVRWSEYWAIIPEYFIVEKYMLGYIQPSVYSGKSQEMTGYSAKAYHWIFKDVPAFKVEPYMTSERDYITKVNFALAAVHYPNQPVMEVMSSWPGLIEDLLKHDHFGQVVVKSSFLKDDAERITSGISNTLKKIEAIHAYLRQTIEWNGVNNLLAGDLKEVLEKKKGTAADINFLMASMLNKIGFLVDMVILSTRDHGFIRPQFPMTEQFNYVVCAARVDGVPILLDATEKYLPFTVLPMRCLNGQGLMVSNISPTWIDLSSATKARTVVDANLSMDNEGVLSGKLQFTHGGYDAFKMRKEYHLKGEDEYVKAFSQIKNWQVEKSEFQNVKDLNLSVKESHQVSNNEHSSMAGDIIYINPFVRSAEEINPFTSKTREFPVDFGCPIEKMFIIKITLPDEFVVDELPQSKIFRLPDNSAKYTYNATQAANIVSITANFQINKALFVTDEYQDLREFYNQVIAKQAEQIVLKKKQLKK